MRRDTVDLDGSAAARPVCGPIRTRDLPFERSTLEHAAARAPVPVAGSPFVDQVVARLCLGERAFGDRWTRQSVAALLGELLEEAADLGAWAVLTLQALDGLDPAARELVQVCVLDAARAGAQAHAAIVQALAVDGVW